MFDGLKKLYKGEEAFQRQICLFSICGIAGLINGYIALAEQSINDITLTLKIVFGIILCIFALFLVGYEILFMHEKEIPDINMQSFKLALNKVPFIIFIIGIPCLIMSIFTKYQYHAFCAETIIAIPLTMLQAGFAINYSNKDYKKLFKIFRLKDYLLMLLKRLWIVIICYAITFALIFFIFFILGLVIAVWYKGDANTIGMVISSRQLQLLKISNYLTSILLTYTLATGILIWDYDVIRTYEKEVADENN